MVEWAIDAGGAPGSPGETQSLSDGERQSVMIARALAQEPVCSCSKSRPPFDVLQRWM